MGKGVFGKILANFGPETEKGVGSFVLTPCFYWRAQGDSNARPTDS